MTNSKTTKRALFSSVVALLLCFTMLLGTTFAWFTDSATSGRNTIQSGNLDVVLEYKTSADGEWAPVTESTKLFKEGALYEPGYTEVVFLRVSNAGSLALKYNLNVNVYGETTSTNIDNETFSLKDSLEIGYYCMDESLGQYLLGRMFGTRDDAINSVNSADGSGFTKISAYDGVVCKDQPLPKGDGFTPLLVALVLTMPESVGNEANHKTGVAAPTIDLGVSLLATQYTDEKDSFGSDYDKDATYGMSSGTDIHNSTTTSGTFKLSSDIKTSDYGDDSRYGYGYEYIIRGGADYTLDLNNKTITHDTVNENANKDAFTYTFVANNAGTKLTINGEGTIYAKNSAGYTCAIQGKDGTLITLNGGDYQVDDGIAVWAGAGSHIVINGGSYVNDNCTTDHELIYSSGGVIDIYGGFFYNADGHRTLNIADRNRATGFINIYGGTFVNFDPSSSANPDPDNIKVADGYKVVSETQANGDIWYTVVAE